MEKGDRPLLLQLSVMAQHRLSYSRVVYGIVVLRKGPFIITPNLQILPNLEDFSWVENQARFSVRAAEKEVCRINILTLESNDETYFKCPDR